jgi:hypothetical protein
MVSNDIIIFTIFAQDMRKAIAIVIVVLSAIFIALSDCYSVASDEILPQCSEVQSELCEQLPDSFIYIRAGRQNTSQPTARRLQSNFKSRKALLEASLHHYDQLHYAVSTFYIVTITSALQQSLTIVLRNIRI